MIQSLAPSLNFPRPTITDGTDTVRPATLRGLGPDQVLVLVNGKRRHQSALVHLNGSVGRGSTGVDLNAIPVSAIDRTVAGELSLLNYNCAAPSGAASGRRARQSRRHPPSRHLDITYYGHHDADMRTTLTLDAEVAARVKSDMRRTGRSLKAVVNDALRRGLGMAGRAPRAPRFTVRPQALGLKPGIDPDRLNQLVDELETHAVSQKLRP